MGLAGRIVGALGFVVLWDHLASLVLVDCLLLSMYNVLHSSRPMFQGSVMFVQQCALIGFA
jgi:hypothetical protein